MNEYAPDQNFKHPACRGSWAFGNNCKVCERCLDTHPNRGGTQFLPNPNHTDTSRSGDLVERLRDSFIYDQQHYAPDPLVAEAADRIEALTAENERLREKLIGIRAEIDDMENPFNDGGAPEMAHGFEVAVEEAVNIVTAALEGGE